MATGTLVRNTTLSDSASKTECHNLIDTATGTLTGIVNADIDAAAAIADTKLATITTTGKINTSALTTTGDTAGDFMYSPEGTTWARLPVGTAGQRLQVVPTVDMMEYSSDGDAQTAYVTNGGTETVTNGGMEAWTGGDTVAPDGWTTNAKAIAKESTIKYAGSYSAKLTSNAESYMYSNEISAAKGINYWKNKTVTYSCWVYATTANRARIYLSDGVGNYYSDYHTGDSTWQLLSVTQTIHGSATAIYCWLQTNTTDSISYFDDASLIDYVLQSYSESTIKTQGSYALKVVANTSALNKTLTRTLSPVLNLSGVDTLKFDIRSSRTGANIKIGIHDSGGTTSEKTYTVLAADTWETVTWDISAVSNANKDAIDSIIITIVNADATNTFYVDNWYSSSPVIRWVTP